MGATRKQAATPRRSRDVQGTLAKPATVAQPAGGIRVRAKSKVFYGGNRYRPGQEFTVAKESEIGKAMERVSPKGGKPASAEVPTGGAVSSSTGKNAGVLGD